MGFTNALGIAGLKTGVVTNTGTVANPYDGQVVYETDNNDLKAYNGASWDVMNGGLVLIKTQTIGSGVSSVEVTGAFSSTYDNYRIILSGGVSSTTVTLRWTLGSTATGYYYASRYVDYAGTSGVISATNSTNFAFGAGSTAGLVAVFDILSPNLVEETVLNWQYSDVLTAGSNVVGSGFLNNTTQYTSITCAPSSGTITGGTIRVYGYINS